MARLEYTTAARLFRRSSHEYRPTSSGSAARSRSALGQRKVMSEGRQARRAAGGLDRPGEGDAGEHAAVADDRRADADHLARRVDQRPARAAGIGGGVELD